MNRPPNTNPLEIGCGAVAEKLAAGESFLLLDCRERDEHALARIEPAMLLPMSEIQERVNELDEHRDSEIVVLCHHGGRSLKVAMWLRGQGFAQARSMAGGIDRWGTEVDPNIPRY